MLRIRAQRWLWLLTLTAIVAGGLLCCLTGQTAAHGLSIALAAVFLAGTVSLTMRFLPNAQPARVRRLSGVIFLLGWAALLAFYLWHFGAAETIYINDDALYYYQQLETANAMNEGLSATVSHVVASLHTDYTCVANLLLAPIFSLTDRSIDGFGLACFLMAWPLLMYQLRRVTLRLADRMQLSPAGTLTLCAGVCVGVFALPLLHRAALWRQVNLVGLPLLVQVMALSFGADFRRREPLRLTTLFLSAVAVALLRRWFLFALAGWLPLWGLWMTWRLLRQRAWRGMARLAAYGALCIPLGMALLWPLLTRAWTGNYSVSYAYWRKELEGLPYEIKNQSWLLGWGSCGLILAGYAWGLLQRRSRELRALTALTLAGAAISLVLFTRIQNMTYHQATLLMPAYVLGMGLFFGMLSEGPRREGLPRGWRIGCGWRIGLTAAVCAALLGQWGLSVTHEKPQQLSPLLSHTSLQPPVRQDMEAIRAVMDFINQTCDGEHPALLLLNSGEYDRLTFVTPDYPDLQMREKVALDRIALPSDGFPRAWFSARYILVPTVPQTNQPGGTVETLTRYLLEDASDRFDVVSSFAFEDFELLVMERTGPVEYAEVEELMALFEEENALYPLVWEERIGWFYGLAVEGE